MNHWNPGFDDEAELRAEMEEDDRDLVVKAKEVLIQAIRKWQDEAKPRTSWRSFSSGVERYSDIVPMYEKYVDPKSSAFTPLIDHFDKMVKKDFEVDFSVMENDSEKKSSDDSEKVYSSKDVGLSDRFPELRTVTSVIINSRGLAFESFWANFLDPWEQMWINQALVAKGLAYSAAAMRRIYRLGRQDAMSIALRTIDCLKGDSSMSSTLGALSLAAGIAGTLVPPAGATIFGVTSAITGIAAMEAEDRDANGKVEGSGFTFTIEGETADDIVDSMSRALNKVDESIRDAEEKLLSSLEAYNDILDKQMRGEYGTFIDDDGEEKPDPVIAPKPWSPPRAI